MVQTALGELLKKDKKLLSFRISESWMVEPLAITVMGKSNTRCAPKYLTYITEMKFKYIVP